MPIRPFTIILILYNVYSEHKGLSVWFTQIQCSHSMCQALHPSTAKLAERPWVAAEDWTGFTRLDVIRPGNNHKYLNRRNCLESNESDAHFSFFCLLAVGAINLIARLKARFWSNPAGDLISRPYTGRLCEQILADWQHVKLKSCQYRTSLVGATDPLCLRAAVSRPPKRKTCTGVGGGLSNPKYPPSPASFLRQNNQNDRAASRPPLRFARNLCTFLYP